MKITRSFIERLLNDLVKATEGLPMPRPGVRHTVERNPRVP
jgi:hypothetical protein